VALRHVPAGGACRIAFCLASSVFFALAIFSLSIPCMTSGNPFDPDCPASALAVGVVPSAFASESFSSCFDCWLKSKFFFSNAEFNARHGFHAIREREGAIGGNF